MGVERWRCFRRSARFKDHNLEGEQLTKSLTLALTVTNRRNAQNAGAASVLDGRTRDRDRRLPDLAALETMARARDAVPLHLYFLDTGALFPPLSVLALATEPRDRRLTHSIRARSLSFFSFACFPGHLCASRVPHVDRARSPAFHRVRHRPL